MVLWTSAQANQETFGALDLTLSPYPQAYYAPTSLSTQQGKPEARARHPRSASSATWCHPPTAFFRCRHQGALGILSAFATVARSVVRRRDPGELLDVRSHVALVTLVLSCVAAEV